MTQEPGQAELYEMLDTMDPWTDGCRGDAALALMRVFRYPHLVKALCEMEDPIGYLRSVRRDMYERHGGKAPPEVPFTS